MGSVYTSVTVTDYNLNPPDDDASQTPSNQLTWAKHKSKLGDPLKTAVEAVNTNAVSAFGKVAGGVTAVNDDYTVLATDQGKLVVQTGTSKTITTPDATSVDEPFQFAALNLSGADGLTIDGSGSQTVDGAASITLRDGQGVVLETDGSNWFTRGQPLSANPQLTTIELGAASDTTLARASAGRMTVEGSNVLMASDIATQADQETGTSTALVVSPGRQQFHPGHPKCWAKVSVSGGTPSLAASYNITGITDNGQSDLTITIATDFSSANWACVISAQSNDSTPDGDEDKLIVNVLNGGQAAGSVRLSCYFPGAGSFPDPTSWYMAGFGDQS